MARKASRSGWTRVEGQSGLVANLHASKRGVQRGIARATERNGRGCWALAYDLAPKDTWFMVEHLRLEFPKSMQSFEVFYDPEEFLSAGENYYPPYVEFGTSISPAQPHLWPAFQEFAPLYRMDVGNEVRKGIAKEVRNR